MNKSVFIRSAQQISFQQPLSNEWMSSPIFTTQSLVKSLNPQFKDYLSPLEARRMGGLQKRALVATLKVLKECNLEHPDAIITGTALGNLICTEQFLESMIENGEQMLSPTHFMQSTHNTIGSALAIYTHNHGYNTTYCHSQMSFDLALQDALMQMDLGKISNALVGAFEEIEDGYFGLLQKSGYIGVHGMDPCSEVTVSMLLTSIAEKENLCRIAGMCICRPQGIDDLVEQLDAMLQKAGANRTTISAILSGKNSNPSCDNYYNELLDTLFPKVPTLKYKQIFGENFTASAFGLYCAANCLKENYIPEFLYDPCRNLRCNEISNILLVNQERGKDYSFILVQKI